MQDKKLLALGYVSAIVLAFLGMIASIVYLFYFSYNSPLPEVLQKETMLAFSAERRMVLLSTAIFVAMSFGFLGFALFLIQAKGDLDAEGSAGDYKLKFARLSPGLFVILCATTIIVICSTFQINYKEETEAVTNYPQHNETKISNYADHEGDIDLFRKYYRSDSLATDSLEKAPGQK